jgi:hypothetical protein
MEGKMKTYKIVGPETEGSINVNDDEMIVYDVCKIADYQGNDYLPREARKLDYHALKEMLYPKPEESEEDV